jgi:hypothetical protein
LFSRLATYPAGANVWQARYREQGTTPWASAGYTGGSSITAAGLLVDHTYEGQVRWMYNLAVVSDWSASKTHTLAP